MKNLKRVLILLVVLAFAFSIVACSADKSPSDAAAEKEEQPAKSDTKEPEEVVEKGSNELVLTIIISDPFFLSIEKKFKEMAEKDGYTVTVMDPNIDNTALQTMIEDIIVKQPAGVAFAPWDDSHVGMAEQLIEAGVTVVAYNVPLTKELIPTILNSDYEGGYLGGEEAARLWKEEYAGIEPILGIVGQPQIGVNVQRAEGFVEGFKTIYPDVKVAPIVDGGGSRDKALPAATDLIQANPDANCFFGINDNTAMGIVDALKEQNKADASKVMVVGFGGSTPILEEMKTEGSVVKAEVGQMPQTMGELTYTTLIDAINGNDGYNVIGVPASMVYADDADDFMSTQYPE